MKNLSGGGCLKKITGNNICLVLSGGEKAESLKKEVKSVGWVELRVDEFLKRGNKIPWKFLRRPGLRVIGTARWKKESQDAGLDITERQRLGIYREIVDYVDYIDVEIKSRIAGAVVEHAKSRGRKVLLSYHDFSKTPSLKKLEKIYAEGKKLEPDIIKIASKVCSEKELFVLMAFTHKYSKKTPLAIAPMDVSPLERLMPLYFGSLFTYVSLGRATAPGQPSLDSLKRMFDMHDRKKI